MSNLPALPDDDLNVGLEDFSQEDMVMPRITIDHESSTFIDQLSKTKYNELVAAPLGLLKSRLLWDAEVSEGKSVPLCRSLDYKFGRPGDDFPVAASGFTEEQVQQGLLPCSDCKLKEWGSHPTNSTPWCGEQMNFVLMVQEAGVWAPAVFTVQRSNLKPAKAYVSAFARVRQPLYTHTCRLTLEGKRRGSVRYSNVVFQKGDPTDESLWPDWVASYKSIRAFLQTPFREETEEEETTVATPTRKAAMGDTDLEWEDD